MDKIAGKTLSGADIRLPDERMALLFMVMLVSAAGNTAMQSVMPSIGTRLGIADVWVSLAYSWSSLLWVVMDGAFATLLAQVWPSAALGSLPNERLCRFNAPRQPQCGHGDCLRGKSRVFNSCASRTKWKGRWNILTSCPKVT